MAKSKKVKEIKPKPKDRYFVFEERGDNGWDGLNYHYTGSALTPEGAEDLMKKTEDEWEGEIPEFLVFKGVELKSTHSHTTNTFHFRLDGEK